MTLKETVAAEEVRRVAELAHLELNSEEVSKMQRDLNAILDYVAQLNELDTSMVAPMAQVSEVLQEAAHPLRADQPRTSLDRSQVMVSAPSSDGIFFKVPKVIER